MRILRGNVGGVVNLLALSGDGRLAASSQGSTYLDVWDLASDRLVDHWQVKQGQHAIYDVAYLPGGPLIAALSDLPPQTLDGTRAFTGVLDRATEFFLLPDVRQVVVRHPQPWSGTPLPLSTLTAWDTRTRPCAAVWEVPNVSLHQYRVSPDGQWAAGRATDWAGHAPHVGFEVLHLPTGKVHRNWPVRITAGVWVEVSGFSADSRHLVVQANQRLEVWSVEDGTVSASQPLATDREVLTVTPHPHGRTLFTAAHADGRVRAWDADTLAARGEYDWGVGPVYRVAVSPDGLTAAAGGDDGRIVVWDLDD